MNSFRIEYHLESGNPYRHRLIVYGVNPDTTNPVEQKQSLAGAEIAYIYLAENLVTCTGVTFRP